MPEESSGNMPDIFDRMIGQLDGLPDVTRTKMVPLRVVPPLGIGGSQSYTVQTYRQRDQGDTIFLEWGNQSGLTRIVIPPDVSAAIARQRQQLTDKVRSKAAKLTAQRRKDAGLEPAFMKGKKRRKK
jgi:hypothetical protein